METRARIPAFFGDRLRNVVIGVAFAVLAVILIVIYVKNYRSDVNAQGDLVSVLVAKRTIAAGTSGSDLARAVRAEKVLRSSVATGAITNVNQLKGQFVSEAVYAGDQVTFRRLRPVAQRGIKGEIQGKLRLLQVPGNQYQLLAGTLQVGDRVDVLASFKVPAAGGQEVAVSRVILRDLLVKSTPAKPDTGAFGVQSTTAQTSVLLEMTDQEAQKLFYVMQNADWTLQLRPKVQAVDTAPTVDWAGSLLTSGLSPAGRATLTRALTSGGSR